MKNRQLVQIMKCKRVILYGIGNQFKECFKIFKEKELVLFDGDSTKWGEYNGNVVHAPQEMPQYIDNTTAIVISSIRNQYEIAKMLVEEIKVPADIIFMYTSAWYEDNVYKLDTIQENWNRIIALSQKFADAESREYYMNSAMARRDRNPLLLTPNPKCIENGEYGNIVCLQAGDTIVDCGAYTGDTAEMYMRRLNNKCRVHAIEPYSKSFKNLQERIVNNSWEENVIAYHCAVGNKVDRTIIKYNQDDFAMAINLSNVEGEENQEVSIETLDHLFENQDISYIKFDIEGQEKNALIGAKKLIQNRHPRLMVSAYHKIEDFWELPEVIWSINENYRIYVGHAPGVSTEMEFYCIDASEEEKIYGAKRI